ncbi:MAG: hypothetical protein MPI95_01050 [Nitrosopumilus sp.]|nr:hypothetical protein [Nitrosopumilus sp.]MDA7957667.1 hypothetical protein [Nitrosopumilus sp.]
MNKQVVQLGLLLRQVPDYGFSMDKFDDRLRLQKTVYLLQAFGVYLGYDFYWYLRGPYCTVLTANAFMLEKIYDGIPTDPKTFGNPAAQERFENFKKFISGMDVDEMEIAASLHYMMEAFGKTEEEAKRATVEKRHNFTEAGVIRVWEKMRRYGLV